MLKKIHHPTFKETMKNTCIVLGTVILGAITFQVLDMLIRRVLLYIM